MPDDKPSTWIQAAMRSATPDRFKDPGPPTDYQGTGPLWDRHLGPFDSEGEKGAVQTAQAVGGDEDAIMAAFSGISPTDRQNMNDPMKLPEQQIPKPGWRPFVNPKNLR
jgi:hypothetical protein